MAIEHRTGLTVLEPRVCWDRLRETVVGRLAVLDGTHLDIFPINYTVDHGTLVFRTAAGTKLAAAVHGGSVAFEIDGWDVSAGLAWSVIVKGAAREIAGMHDVVDAVELPLFPWHNAPKPRFVRIVPETVTGREFRAAIRPTS